MADIDHFKEVNDNNGHLAGDHILKVVAQLLKDFLRITDTVARYGGDEFVIILPETSLNDALTVTERIRKAVDSTDFRYENRIISVSLSFGISSLNSSRKASKTDFIKEADDALYQAKKAGRNTCQYFKEYCSN